MNTDQAAETDEQYPGVGPRPYGVGVVGLGDISRVYLDNLRKFPEIVRVVAAAGRDEQRTTAAARRHGIPVVHPDVQALAADPAVDIVLCLTPPESHATVLHAAIDAGKHVYTEKSLTTTMAEGVAVLQAAERAGVVIGCAPDTVLGGRVQTMRELLDAGRIGRVTGGVVSALLPGLEHFHTSPLFYYGPGVGPMMDLGPYYLATLVTLLGPVRRVSGMSTRTWDERPITGGPLQGGTITVGVDTSVSALLEFRSGAVASAQISWDVWDSTQPRIELYGTGGTMSVLDPDPLDGPNVFGGPLQVRSAEQARFVVMPRAGPLPDADRLTLDRPFSETSHAENSRGLGLLEMADALRGGRRPRLSGEFALHVLEIATAVLTSAREARFVDLTTSCERPEPLPVDFLVR